jgi:hypothetical protein
MTLIIDDKDKNKIPYEEYTNPQITIQDIRICSIRQIPLPGIVNSIYRSTPSSDIWLCENCKTRGDKWYLMIHLCKVSLSKPLTKAELQEDEKRQHKLERSKWTCPVYKVEDALLYKKLHYQRCFAELRRTEESEREFCENCGKSINSYYRNFHYPHCEKQLIKKVKVTKRTPEETLGHTNELRITHEYHTKYSKNLSEFMNNKAVLENGYWILYRNNRRIRIVEKATREALTSWHPKADEKH